MSIQTLSHTLQSVAAGEVSGEKLTDPISSTFEKVLNILTLGIYGAYLTSTAAETQRDLLDIGKALLKWDPDTPDIPVHWLHGDRYYELSDTPHGGICLRDRASGQTQEIDGVTIDAVRDMIFSELMHHDDFSKAMEGRIFEDTTTYVDIVGLKQERANACGEASKNMILAHHGQNYAPATNERFLLTGSMADDVFPALRNAGLNPEMVLPATSKAYTSAEILEKLKSGPLLCNLVGHFVVVHGVNEMLDRVEIFCPLMGARSASLKDFNAHLDWSDYVHPEDPLNPLDLSNDMLLGDVPLTAFSNTKPPASGRVIPGKNLDPDFSPSAIDQMGVAVLKTFYGLNNSWLKAPD